MCRCDAAGCVPALVTSGVFFVFQLTPRATLSLEEFVQGQKGQSRLLRVFLGHVEQQQSEYVREWPLSVISQQ